jgi:imidazolonepropionase-like amidohydrolase
MTAAGRRLLHGARVLTCEDTSVIDDGTVVFDGDRIAWVGPTQSLPESLAVGAEITDASGCTAMPGLVDAHMHISFGEAASEEELAIHTPPAYRAIRAAVDARSVLHAGVTSACDPGGPRGIATAVRDAIDAGLVAGPRLAAAGPQITTQQGIGDTMPAPLGDLSTSLGALVRSLDDIRQEIRNEVKEGVDLIKIAGSGPGTREYGAFSLDELMVAVTEAHRLDRPITIHARSRQAVADAVSANFDWIMHASFMDDDTLDRLVERNIPVVPAMTLLVNSIEAGRGVRPSFVLDAMQRELDAAVAILSKARSSGALLIAGSESGFAMTPYGHWHTREMELFVELLDFGHHEALLAMTRDAASAIPRFGHEVGTLTAGKYADVLLVRGEPDRNVHLLADHANISAVFKSGEEVLRDSEVRRRQAQPFERTRLFVDQKLYRTQIRHDGESQT